VKNANALAWKYELPHACGARNDKGLCGYIAYASLARWSPKTIGIFEMAILFVYSKHVKIHHPVSLSSKLGESKNISTSRLRKEAKVMDGCTVCFSLQFMVAEVP
jgi:hypothetical protein